MSHLLLRGRREQIMRSITKRYPRRQITRTDLVIPYIVTIQMDLHTFDDLKKISKTEIILEQ